MLERVVARCILSFDQLWLFNGEVERAVHHGLASDLAHQLMNMAHIDRKETCHGVEYEIEVYVRRREDS